MLLKLIYFIQQRSGTLCILRRDFLVFHLILYTKCRVVFRACVCAACGRWRVPGVGNCLFLCARGQGIDRQVIKKMTNPRGYARGVMVISGTCGI